MVSGPGEEGWYPSVTIGLKIVVSTRNVYELEIDLPESVGLEKTLTEEY